MNVGEFYSTIESSNCFAVLTSGLYKATRSSLLYFCVDSIPMEFVNVFLAIAYPSNVWV